MVTRTYSELLQLETFDERLDYLSVHSRVGGDTFGSERWMNQRFYKSREWQSIRSQVMVRDYGCEFGLPGWEIGGPIYIHHMNPIMPEDISAGNEDIFDPEYLTSCSLRIHNAVHYGSKDRVPISWIERAPGDTIPWLGEHP